MLRRLRQLLVDSFSDSELRDLCFEMQPRIDYELLPGSSKADKARELILFCERHGRMDELATLCQQLRPHAFPPQPAPPTSTRSDAARPPREDWGEAPDVSDFHGRTAELTTLTDWITHDQCRLIGILGLGGMGKTTLATRTMQQHASQFAYVIWRSLRNAPPINDLLGACILFLSDQRQTDLPDDLSGRIDLLMNYLRKHRCLLLLDNVETLLQSGPNAGAYCEGYAGYGDLIRRVGETQHQSLLLLTSREKPQEFARLEGARVRTLALAGVTQSDGRAILQDKQLSGTDAAWDALIQHYSGNPLALKLTAEPIREIFAGDITRFLQSGEIILGDIVHVLAEQFARLAPLEQEIIYWLAIEREPVEVETLRETMLTPASMRDLLEALNNLRRRSMVEQSAAGLTLQNVVMEYVTERLIDQVCAEIISGSIQMLNTHALMKAQAKEYVRHSQVRLILDEVVTRLEQQLGSRAAVVERLTEILALLRQDAMTG